MLVCQDVADPLNVGSLFRLADAMGVQRIYLCGDSPAPPHTKISRTARSTVEFVPFEYHASTAELLVQLKAAGHQLVGLEITDESVAIDQFDFTAAAPLALILGAESVGLLPDTLALLDAAVHIPMYGRNTSMNVVQACAMALYEITRQQLGTGVG